MKTFPVIIFFILFHFTGHTQDKFLPVIDSSLICSYKKGILLYAVPDAFGYQYPKLHIYYIVEEMPEPEISNKEIELLLEENISFNSQEVNCQGIIYLQCIVNCEGRAGDYQIQKCPAELINIGCRISNFFSLNIYSWSPPIQRGKSVDLLAEIRIGINNGKFKVYAPYY